MMKQKLGILAVAIAICLSGVLPAMADNVLAFTEKAITLNEGETAETALNRDGAYAEGDITYSSESAKIATVSEDGAVTAVAKGKTRIVATLTQNGKQVRRASLEVTVVRPVTKVTLSRKNMPILEPDDPSLADLQLTGLGSDPVILLIAGRSVSLSAVCSPEDASNRKVSFSSSDVGVAKIQDGNRLRGVEKGECQLTVASVQNPEVQELFHVVVIEPVKKVQIKAPGKTVFAGEQMELNAVCTPDTASIRKVVWKSTKPSVATVDENGLVTGLAKGETTIEARTTDGTDIAGTIKLTVAQKVTEVSLKRDGLVVLEPDDPTLGDLQLTGLGSNPVLVVLAGRSINLSGTCKPDNANNRQISYTSSDAGIAKVEGNRLRGVEKGECELTVASVQNPEVQELFHVVVIEPVKKVTVEAPSKTVFAGEQMELNAVITPNTASIQKVTWKSNKPSVATVDENGLVSGLAKGEATIEARTTDGTNIAGSIRLTVAQQVTETTLKQEEVTVSTGRSVRLEATVLPKEANNKKLTWSSSDETIATVGKDGTVTGRKAGICVVTCVSESNPMVSASAAVQVVQPVTKITFNQNGTLTFPIRTSQQLSWNVEPYDASIKDVTFKSNHPDIATVDENGLVTGIKRGEVTITATAVDGSKRSANIRVVITQPVEGVTLSQQMYYVQRGRSKNIRATVLPKNANNQKVYWEIDDNGIASVRSSGTSTGQVTGLWDGISTITAITDDGGYTASAQIMVADFDAAIMVEGLEITSENKIRLTLRNTCDLTINRVFFKVDCYDPMNQPMIYNRDGVTTGFDGIYPLPLRRDERSQHGQFYFNNIMETGMLGAVVVTITGYEFENGQQWEIPEEAQIPTMPAYSDLWGKVTPTPMPPMDPTDPIY